MPTNHQKEYYTANREQILAKMREAYQRRKAKLCEDPSLAAAQSEARKRLREKHRLDYITGRHKQLTSLLQRITDEQYKTYIRHLIITQRYIKMKADDFNALCGPVDDSSGTLIEDARCAAEPPGPAKEGEKEEGQETAEASSDSY